MERGIESFLPLRTRISHWKDRRKQIDVPMVPGYCFARFSLGQTFLVLQIRDVVDIIEGPIGQSVSLAENGMAAMQRVIASGQTFDLLHDSHEGMLVQVVRGPLIGIHGRLVKTSLECRLVITIPFIGQCIAVQIDAADVASVLIVSLGCPTLL